MADTGAAKAKDAQQNKPDLTDQILYPKMEDWARIGAEIGNRQQSAQWDLGDWILGGESRFSKQLEGSKLYEEAEAHSGVARQSLYKYAYVSRNCIRMQGVCWAIHQLVTPLPKEKQELWLNRAKAGKLTVSQMRVQLDAEAKGNDTPRLFNAIVPLTQKDYDQLDRWAWARGVNRGEILHEIVGDWLKENKGRLGVEAAKREKIEAKEQAQRQKERAEQGRANRRKTEKQWRRNINALLEQKEWDNNEAMEFVTAFEVQYGTRFPFPFARKHTEFGNTFGRDISAESCACGEFSLFDDNKKQHDAQASL